LCAVEKRKTLFRFQRDRRNLRAPQSFAAGQNRALKFGMAFADDDFGEMRERRQVARSSDRALRGN
jgi:hypothetical protein